MKRLEAALIAITCVGFLAACGGGMPPTPSPAPATATLAPATPASSGASPASAGPSPLPLKMGTLEPGRYHTNSFDPQLVLTLPAGWSQFFADDADEVFLGSSSAELAIARAAEVRDPETSGRVAAPEDLLAWLIDHSALDSSEPTPVTISGIESNYVEFKATREVRLFAFETGDFRIGAGPSQRMYVVPMDGPDLALTVTTPHPGTLEAALTAAVPIVESLQIVP